jgi:hypothetical protein
MLNFIPTPHVAMNELLYEPKKHNHLQDVIDMFTLHIHPRGNQKTCQHFDKINTWTSKEIANSDIISIVIWKNIVNSFTCGKTLTIRKTMCWRNNLLASQLFVCGCVILNTEGHLTFLPPQLALDGLTRLWQLIACTWELLELED